MKGVIVAVVSLAVLILAGSASAQTTCTPPPSGLVSWWPGDGNATDIQGGNDGTLVGTVNFVTGKVGQAFGLNPGDGVDYVRVPDATSLEPTNVTVDAWVRSASTPGVRYIVSKGATGCSHSSYALYTDAACGGVLSFYVARPASAGGFVACSPALPAAQTIWDGNWHHIAGTYDGQYVRLYVDGAQIGSGTAYTGGIDYTLPLGDLLIGQYGGSCSLPWHGDIDEVEVFNRALLASEIAAIHTAGPAGKCIPVQIDIKPGSDPNSINCSSKGVIPVAILSSATFDATTVDPLTIDVAGASVRVVGKDSRPLCHAEYVNDDLLLDLVCQVETVDWLIECPSEGPVMLQATANGRGIIGQDTVRIVPDN